MIERIIVLTIVAVCVWVVVRVVLRVFAGKQSNCGMCNDCEVLRSCDKTPSKNLPKDCPQAPEATEKSDSTR